MWKYTKYGLAMDYKKIIKIRALTHAHTCMHEVNIHAYATKHGHIENVYMFGCFCQTFLSLSVNICSNQESFPTILYLQQAQLRLCKLGPGTVLILYKSLAPTPIYT